MTDETMSKMEPVAWQTQRYERGMWVETNLHLTEPTATNDLVVIPLYDHPTTPSQPLAVDIAGDNDGKEQDAFEEWAKSECYDMHQHPLHWLFMDKRTAAARNGWRAGIRYAQKRALSPAHIERVREMEAENARLREALKGASISLDALASAFDDYGRPNFADMARERAENARSALLPKTMEDGDV
jgi:hypothetical protein